MVLSTTYDQSSALCSHLFVVALSAAVLSGAHLRPASSAGAKSQQALAATPAVETGSGPQAAKRHKSATPKAEAPIGTGNNLPMRAAANWGISFCLTL